MKSSKSIYVLLLLGIALGACSTQSGYRPAQGSGYGYSDNQIAEGQYQIDFRSRGDDTARAMDYALLRASELTMEQSYDWFAVASRETYVNQESVAPTEHISVDTTYQTYQSCGLLSCRTYVRPATVYRTDMTLGDERSEVEITLQINMGKGTRPDGVETHDAREVFADLNPQAER